MLLDAWDGLCVLAAGDRQRRTTATCRLVQASIDATSGAVGKAAGQMERKAQALQTEAQAWLHGLF